MCIRDRFRRLPAAPTIERERGREMHHLPTRGEQGLAERFLRRAKGDAADAGAVARAQLDANMATRADLDGIGQAMRREDEDRFRAAGAEGAGLVDLREDCLLYTSRCV